MFNGTNSHFVNSVFGMVADPTREAEMVRALASALGSPRSGVLRQIRLWPFSGPSSGRGGSPYAGSARLPPLEYLHVHTRSHILGYM